jgi:hypothetical protein
MSNHFNYLLHEANVKPSVSADRLMLMAKTASGRYLSDGTPMNETITKIAEESDLNSHQIERVCEMANIQTHQALWPSATEKEKIAFPVASPKMVVIRLGGRPAPSDDGGGCGPSGSTSSDYMSPPSDPSSGPSMSSLFGADPGSSHNGMHEDTPRQKIVVLIQKKAAERDRIKDQLIVNTMQWESEKRAAYNAIKQEVLGGTPLSDVRTATYAAGLGKIAAEVLPGFRDQLVAETHGSMRAQLEKVAIAPAPDDLISDNLGNMTVVNGAHPVLITLDLLHKRDCKIKQLFTGLSRVNDELTVYGQKIREL